MKLQHVILCLFYLKGYQMDCKKCISDIVGITHYRRFFSKNILDSIKKKPIEKKEINILLNKAMILAIIFFEEI